MTEKEKPLAGGNPEELQHKYSSFATPKQKIRSLFLSGRQFTARKLNRLTNSNDARKCISDLRKEGMRIKDRRLENGVKLYWLQHKDSQLTLFGKGGEV